MNEKQRRALRRLGTFIEDRADELDLQWNQLAAESGITVQTLRQMRTAANMPSRNTKRGLEIGLRWKRGSVNAILAGGEPTPLAESETSYREDDDFDEEEFDARIERIRRNPDARKVLRDLMLAARLGEDEDAESTRHRKSAG